MSYSPVKFLAGCIVEVGGFALLLCCLPMLSEQTPPQPAESRAELGTPLIVAVPRSDFSASVLQPAPLQLAAPPAGADSAREEAAREQYVARTLDAAGHRLASAVSSYLQEATTEVLSPITNDAGRPRLPGR